MTKLILIGAVTALTVGPVLGAVVPFNSGMIPAEAKRPQTLQKGATVDRLAAAEQTTELATSREGPIALGSGPTRIVLSAPPLADAIGKRVKMLRPADQVYLILKGIEAEPPPSITYNVFMGLPEAARSASPGDPQYVGTFSFFNAGPLQNAVFNVTDKIRTYVETGLINDHAAITVIPAGEPEAGAKPMINQVALVATHG
jgi:hypothetical protein